MSRNLPALFTEEAHASEGSALLHLVTLTIPEVAQPLYLVDTNHNVMCDGTAYTRFPFSYKGLEQHSDGTISKASLTVANVSREIMYYVESYDGLRGAIVAVKHMFARALDEIYTPHEDGTVTTTPNPEADPNAYVFEEYVIDGYSADENVVNFVLEPRIDFTVQLPRRRFTSNSCYWHSFKDPETCGYSGTATECDKTFDTCIALGNAARFGGFPGVPRGGRNLYIR